MARLYLKSIVFERLWGVQESYIKAMFETSPTQFFWLAIVISNCSMWLEDFKFLK